MIKYYRFSIFTFLLLIPLSMIAQTSSEFRQKYKVSSVVESYEIRTGVIATVEFGESGQPVSILVKPVPTFDSDDKSKTEMPFKIIEEVINQLVPIAQRGRLFQDIGPESGRNYYRYENYENVEISSKIHNWGAPNATISQVYIIFKKSFQH